MGIPTPTAKELEPPSRYGRALLNGLPDYGACCAVSRIMRAGSLSRHDEPGSTQCTAVRGSVRGQGHTWG